MYIAAAILSVLLALVTVASGLPKLLLKGDVPANLQSHMGLSPGLVRFIGLAEASAAFGLIVGLFWQPLGIAAAAGFAITMIGAIFFHLKVGDYADAKTRGSAMAAPVLTLVSVATAGALALAM